MSNYLVRIAEKRFRIVRVVVDAESREEAERMAQAGNGLVVDEESLDILDGQYSGYAETLSVDLIRGDHVQLLSLMDAFRLRQMVYPPETRVLDAGIPMEDVLATIEDMVAEIAMPSESNAEAEESCRRYCESQGIPNCWEQVFAWRESRPETKERYLRILKDFPLQFEFLSVPQFQKLLSVWDVLPD